MTQSRDRLLAGKEKVFVETSATNLIAFLSRIDFKEFLNAWEWTMAGNIEELLDDENITAGSMSGMKSAVNVKRSIRKRLKQEITQKQKMDLFRWFVKDYGQVKTNKQLDEKIKEAIHLGNLRRVDTADNVQFANISTISKCLTLFDERLPIYDSRVSFAMNAINFSEGDIDIYMREPDGRNASLNLFDLRPQFLMANTQRVDRVIEILGNGGRTRASQCLKLILTEPDRTYVLWCHILAAVRKQLENQKEIEHYTIDELEFILFSCAPTACVLEIAKSYRK